MSGAPSNRALRTRRDLLDAASRLMRDGRTPAFEEIAEAAGVSRATAYRYFPGLEALLHEAGLHVVVPRAEELFGADAPADPTARLELLDDALFSMLQANEPAMRALLANSLQPGAEPAAPVRQNRRSPLIDAALDPVRDQFRPDALGNLKAALVPLMGVEALVAFKDVLGVDAAKAREVRHWAIRALVAAARRA
jgi:AcrR family transcriptional regulator